MARLHPKYNWNLQAGQNPHDDLLQCVIQSAWLAAVNHFAEHDATYALELSRELQLHQHAVDAIRPLGPVFDKQDGSCRLKFVGRTQRGAEQRQTATVEDSLCFPSRQNLNFV